VFCIKGKALTWSGALSNSKARDENATRNFLRKAFGRRGEIEMAGFARKMTRKKDGAMNLKRLVFIVFIFQIRIFLK